MDTTEKIIRRLWSATYDLLLYNEGKSNKELEEIKSELDAVGRECATIWPEEGFTKNMEDS